MNQANNPLKWLKNPTPEPSLSAREAAALHQRDLAKPFGALGALESIAIEFASWQNCKKPKLENVCQRIFVGDHGVTAEGVSVFGQQTTSEMMRNVASERSAIGILSAANGIDVSIVNLGTVLPVDDLPSVIDLSLAAGTANFCKQPAMDDGLLLSAMEAGREYGARQDCQLFIGGEIGVGNTSSASAICSAALTLPVEQSVGRGSGVDDSRFEQKQKAIRTALDRHRTSIRQPLGVLAHVGGLEIAALTAAYIDAAQRGIPSLIDGFVCSAAALLACQINPGVRRWLIFSHRSLEPGHEHILTELDAKPLLDLKLRLGEATGAALALPLIRSALLLHEGLARFSSQNIKE